MKCSGCGADNLSGSAYCDACGQALASSSAKQEDSQAFSKAGSVRLVVIRGDSKGRVFELEEGSNLIGRWDPDSGAFPEVDLEAEDIEAKISRKHAIIERAGTTITLEDIGSLNGTFINRVDRLDPGKKVQLQNGDEIIIGKTFLRLEIV